MTRKLQWFIIALFLCSLPLHAQVPLLEFAIGIGGTGDDSGSSIVTDASGNIYMTGFFRGTIDVDPGVGVYNLTSQGETDIYALKLNSQGGFLWAHSVGEPSHDYFCDLNLDASGNVYLTGYITTLGTFIQKMDMDGNLVWERFIKGPNPTSVATDASGNVYLTGEFAGTVDFDPGAGTFFKPSEGPSVNGFVLKLDGEGNFLWVKSSASTYEPSLATDAYGNVLITGRFSGVVDFDPGEEILNLTAGANTLVFIQKLDTHGNLIWAKMLSGDTSQPSITTDVSGNVLVTGRFGKAVDFDPGEDTFVIIAKAEQNCFILKLDKDGNFIWAKSNNGALCYGRDIITDASEDVYIIGEKHSALFAQRLDTQGNLLWVKSFSGNESFGSKNRSINIDTSGNVYLTGDLKGTIDFDPGKGTYNLVSKGERDAFVLKLSQCIPTAPVPDVAQLEVLKAECVVERPAAPTASNNCGESFTATTDTVFPITTPGTTLITWTFTDPHGHTVTQQQKVILEDVTAPVPDLTQLEDLHGQCALDTAIAPTATDNCGKVYTGTAGVSFPLTAPGTTLITWTFEDEQGNQSTQTQKVILEDTTPPVPVVEHLPDLISQCSAAMPTPPTATDNCDQMLTATTTVPFPITTPGTTVVQWLFEDQAGNTATQTQNIIVEEPLVPEICLVTVDETTGRNKLIWTYDSDNVERFGVYRETNVAHEYALITYVDSDMLNAYIDQQSLPAQKSNRYKISVVDSCGFESDLSHTHKTIHLTINKGVDDAWNLIWDGYEGLSFGTYRIYRGTDENSLELLTEIASNLTSFTDTEAPAGRVAYQIEVLKSNSCGTTTNQRSTEFISSRSNIARSSVVTSIGDSLDIKTVLLYPNPVEDILQIDKRINKALRIEIWDNSGKLITSFTSNQQVNSIDMSGYASGLYFVKLNGKLAHKVVKQ